MTQDDKTKLFIHWLVYQCAGMIFKEKLTKSEIKQLYYLIYQDTMKEIEKRIGTKVKTIKYHRGSIYKKIKPELLNKTRTGKDNVFFNLLLKVIPHSIEDDFFDKWRKKYDEISKENPFEDKTDKLKIDGRLPVGLKNF